MSESESQTTGGPIGGHDDPADDPAPAGAVIGGPGFGDDDIAGDTDLAPNRDTDDSPPAPDHDQD